MWFQRPSRAARVQRAARSSAVGKWTRCPASIAARASPIASIVLPTPGGPMNKTLAASSRNRSVAVADQRLVHAGLSGVVVVGQGVAGGQAGEVGARGQPAGLGGVDLDREQPLQGGHR